MCLLEHQASSYFAQFWSSTIFDVQGMEQPYLDLRNVLDTSIEGHEVSLGKRVCDIQKLWWSLIWLLKKIIGGKMSVGCTWTLMELGLAINIGHKRLMWGVKDKEDALGKLYGFLALSDYCFLLEEKLTKEYPWLTQRLPPSHLAMLRWPRTTEVELGRLGEGSGLKSFAKAMVIEPTVLALVGLCSLAKDSY